MARSRSSTTRCRSSSSSRMTRYSRNRLSNMKEVESRNGRIIAVTNRKSPELERIAADIIEVPTDLGAADTGADDCAAATARVSYRGRARHRRRPASQPGEVGDGGMRKLAPVAIGLAHSCRIWRAVCADSFLRSAVFVSTVAALSVWLGTALASKDFVIPTQQRPAVVHIFIL